MPVRRRTLVFDVVLDHRRDADERDTGVADRHDGDAGDGVILGDVLAVPVAIILVLVACPGDRRRALTGHVRGAGQETDCKTRSGRRRSENGDIQPVRKTSLKMPNGCPPIPIRSSPFSTRESFPEGGSSRHPRGRPLGTRVGAVSVLSHRVPRVGDREPLSR